MSRQLTFIRKEVADLLGLRPSLVQFYTDQGIITPEVSAPKGRGTRRVYSRRNLLEILVVSELVSTGIALEDAKSILHALRDSIVNLLNPEDFPSNLPRAQKQKFMESSDLHRRLWGIEKWPFGHHVFLWAHYKKGRNLSTGIGFIEKDKSEVKFHTGEDLTGDTKRFLVVNITRLVEKVALA